MSSEGNGEVFYFQKLKKPIDQQKIRRYVDIIVLQILCNRVCGNFKFKSLFAK